MPSGIIIAAIVTAVLGLLVGGGAAWRMAPPQDRRWLLLGLVLALPLQPAVFWLLRMPLHEALLASQGPGGVMAWLPILYAPCTEEPAKWLVLLALRRRITTANAVPMAIAIGAGFGIGEIGFLAERLLHVPAYAAMPAWMFGGFLGERLLVVFLHGLLITFLARALARRRGILAAAAAGLALHLAVNAPILLIAAAPFGLPAAIWQQLVSLWLVAVVVALAIWALAAHRRVGGAAPFGDSTCPECGERYPRPLLALNLGPRRYERCPCRKWHMVR